MKLDTSFNPEITVFACIYCGYMAADTAGSLRNEYPASIKIVRLPCTGKTDIQYLLDAFEEGADGVYIVACSLGNCHHEHGNERGYARMLHARKIIESIGLEPERLDMFFVSGGMGASFAQHAQEMTERIRQLGPNPLKQALPVADSEHQPTS
jgi:F420-non-reducing hydrogenase iron-sulfur subunit